MPRAGDKYPGRRGADSTHSPLRGLLDYTSPLDDTIKQSGDQIKRKIEDVVAFLSGATGWDIQSFLDNLASFIPGIDLTSGFDFNTAAQDFINSILNPQDMLTPLVAGFVEALHIPGLDTSKITTGTFDFSQIFGLTDAFAGVDLGATNPIIAEIDAAIGAIPGAQALIDTICNAMGIPGTGHTLSDVLTGLTAIPGGNLLGVPAGIVSGLLTAANIPGLDVSKIITGVFGTGVIPDLDAAKIVSGFLGTGRVPGLDTSKIISGTFPQSMLSITSIAAGIVSGTLTAANIPGLDVSKIVSGIFGTGVIPDLDASKIITGAFGGARIPSLDTSKITTGQFPQSMLNITSIAASLVSGALTAANIPGLDVSKIITGIFGVGQIPNLPASQVTSGTFTTGLIPPLPTSQITSGVFGAGFIPNLDTSKITTGLFPQSQTTNLVSDLLNKLGVNIFQGSAQAGSNLMLDPAFEDTTIARNAGGGAGSGYSTDQAHSGTHSYKIVSAGGYDEFDFLSVPGGAAPQTMAYALKVQPGQRFYIEAWVRPKSTNTAGSFSGILARFDDSTGVNALNYTWANPGNAAPPDPTINVWTKLSGYLTVPAGYDRFLPFWSTSSPTTVGNTYYIDDVTVREETAPQNIIQQLFGGTSILSTILAANVPNLDTSKITTGTFPQSQVATLPADLAARPATTTSGNLAVNPNFATNITGWALWQWGGAALASWDGTQGHTANGSMKLPFAGGSQQSAADLIIPCVPGQSFSISLWAKWDANGGGAYLGVYAGDSQNRYVATAAETTHNLSTVASSWVQHTFTFTAPAGVYSLDLEAASQTTGAAGALWVDDIVITQTNALSPAVTPNSLGDIQRLVDSITSAFFGSTTVASSQPDALLAMQKQQAQVVQNTANIQALKAAALSNTVSGKSVSINFGDYANGPLPSIFTVTYTGIGTSTVGVVNGEAVWNSLVNDNDRTAKITYNVAPTDTDFQIIRGTMNQAPNDGGISGNPRIWALGRVNAARDSYVWARGYSVGWFTWKADIGCTVGGAETVWVSGIPLTWALDMYWKVGVGATARQYELWSGNTLVYTHTEVGTSSQLGSGNRLWGSIAEMRKGSVNGITSGKIGGTSVSDNSPAAVMGTHAHIYRTNTATANLTGASAWTLLPASFFGSTLRASTDLTVDLANGKITATKAGSYTINVRIRLSTSVAANVFTGLYKNGALDQVSDFWFPGDTTGESIGGHFTTQLAAGDYIQIATFSAGVTVTVLTGEATGTQTYLNITGVGGMN